MFSKKLFGQRIREMRKLNKETQQALADILGMLQNNVSEMESGKKTTTAEKIVRICLHYHISADYLLGLSDDPEGGCAHWTEVEDNAE